MKQITNNKEVTQMKKKTTFKTTAMNSCNKNNDALNVLKVYQRMERENNLKLLPTTDINKLGVLYTCMDVNGEIRISFFDRTKTSSVFDVMEKARDKRNDIVGEDCLFYPAQIVGAAIVPNWKIQSLFSGAITGAMNFTDFVDRMVL